MENYRLPDVVIRSQEVLAVVGQALDTMGYQLVVQTAVAAEEQIYFVCHMEKMTDVVGH